MVNWQDFPSVLTPLTAANLAAAFAEKVAVTTLGAASGTATLDSTTHVPVAQIPDLSGTYATNASQTAAIAALQAQSASIEDLFVNVVLSAATITTTTGVPGFIAPFPLTITSISLVLWSGSTVAANDTNYWTVNGRRVDAGGSQVTIGSKTTQVTGGAAFPYRTAWTFNTAAFTNANLVAGQMVDFAFLPTGAPASIGGPVVATIGYRPI